MKPGLVSHGYNKPDTFQLCCQKDSKQQLEQVIGRKGEEQGSSWVQSFLSERRGNDIPSYLLVFLILFDLQKFNIVTLFNLLNPFLYGFCLLSWVQPHPVTSDYGSVSRVASGLAALRTGAHPWSCHPGLEVCIVWHTVWPLR